MTLRPKPKYASKNSRDGCWLTCDRCGFIWNSSRTQFQFAYRGGSTPINTQFIHCQRCVDPLNEQFKLLILPPDPPPLLNLRPENYTVDETNYFTTMSGDIIDTQAGSPFITSIPNPADNANTAYLKASLKYHLGSLAVAYLDFFNGSPVSGGVSVLAAITGSSVRPNIASQLTIASGNIAENTDVLTITSSAASITNVGFAAIYNAASGGVLLTSGPVSATQPTIVAGAAVQFNALGLTINLN